MPVTQWSTPQLSSLNGFVGQLNTLSTGITTVTGAITGVITLAKSLLDILIPLAPSSLDPTVLAVQAAVAALESQLKDFAFSSVGVHLLLIPPTSGGTSAYFNLVNQALDDTKDSSRPPSGNDFVAGITSFAASTNFVLTYDIFKAFTNLYEQSPQATVNVPRPSNLKVKLSGTKPFLSWTSPSVTDLLSGRIKVKSGTSGTVAEISDIEQIYIYREEGEPDKLKGELLDDSLIIHHANFDSLINFYLDNTAENKKYTYKMSWDLTTSTGETINKVGSVPVTFNLPQKQNQAVVSASSGVEPNFISIIAKDVVPGLNTIITFINNSLSKLKGLDVSVKKELESLRDFLDAEITRLNTEVSKVTNAINKFTSSLTTIASAGINFGAFSGNGGVSFVKEAMTELSASDELPSGDLTTGFLLVASSSNAAAVLSFYGIIKLIFGIRDSDTEGDLTSLTKTAKDAANAIESLGGSLVSTSESTAETTSRTFIRFADNLEPIDG